MMQTTRLIITFLALTSAIGEARIRGQRRRRAQLQGLSVELVIIGNNDPNMPLLGLCQGECDLDSDCQAGLICYQRDAGDPVPGCAGNDNASNGDYCTFPETDPPTKAPTRPPTRPPTFSPTTSPTLPPTRPPTLPPTRPPTLPPTRPPTLPPTRPPTLPPTRPPTLPPTRPPTSSPTNVPTAPLFSPVVCGEVSNFTATTEIFFDSGRPSPLLTVEERERLNMKFIDIYNLLSVENCDANFRRVNGLEFVSEQINDNTGARRSLQIADGSNNSTNTTGRAEISMTYQVMGSCRNCQVTATRSYQLYDDAFRRALLLAYGVVKDEYGSNRERNLQLITDECICPAGKLPTESRAVGVQTCVDTINSEFQALEREEGLFGGINMTDLVQLEDPEEPSKDDKKDKKDKGDKDDEEEEPEIFD